MSAAPTVRIPITRPVIGDEELRAVQHPLESGWVVQGPYVKRFEDRFAAFVDAPHAVATTSCTTALHLAMAALGVKPGDEVIVPAFTWIATPNVVEYMGARPVFCDIDPATFNIDPVSAEASVTPRTVGIIPVHLFGLCADMDAIETLARRHGIWVVEDAACGFGARLRGRHCGTFGAAGCFSFHPRKAITTGEGGMITTGDADLARLVSSLRDHGASRSDLARHEGTASFLLADYPHLGYNFRMTDIQGALGCAQMDRAAWVLEHRQRVARTYDARLAGLEWLVRPVVPDGFDHGYQSYVCMFAPETQARATIEPLHHRRNALMAAMEAGGVATRPGTHAPVLADYYRRKYAIAPEAFPHAWAADRLSVSLPIYPQMTEAEIDRVSTLLRVGAAA
ncbi:MAG: DegT/DnrJ/EryC1/StrS family aminotransferase [Acidobacteriota bacterium]